MPDQIAVWIGIVLTSAGAYLLKLTGYLTPDAVLERPRVRRAATLAPIGLLAALTAVLVFGDGASLVVDARAAGLAFAVIALVLRAPFFVVVVGAAVVAAVVRQLAG
jgi:uncharacterized membrane protein